MQNWPCSGSIPIVAVSEGIVRIICRQYMSNSNVRGQKGLKRNKTNPGQFRWTTCMFIQTYLLTCKGGSAITALCSVRFKHHSLYEITPELSLALCAHPHLRTQNFRKVISTFALEVTIEAVFELQLASEPQRGFPGSFLTWRGWYKDKLLGHHIYNSPLNLMLCRLSSDAFPFVPTLAVFAK